MRIGIDGRFLNESGVGRYIRNLISNLKDLDKQNQYFIFLLKEDYEKFTETKNFKKVLADFKWYGFIEQVKFPSLLKKYNLDLVHFPHFNFPIFYKNNFIVTIHDLIHQHFNMEHSTTHGPLIYKLKTLGYRTVFKHAVNKSSQILVPSEYVRKQLINDWKINSQKITVTAEGVEDSLLAKGGELPDGVRKPYIFFVGNAHPHKNVEGLIKAFLILRKKYQYLQLVLAGKDSYFWRKLLEKYQHSDILYTGFVPDKKLVTLYKEADVYVEPSFEEGFGIPILEAMALGTAVVSSRLGSLPEVGGDAVLYFNPNDSDDMVNKISQVLNSKKLRKELIENGKKRVKLFSWKKMAEQTLEVYASSNRS
ncbi:hypothetical protein A3C59_04770 [Candidatus Daviesbacteria bacterium RIFCSPHIGHO2_02_FULL_36_13]|uniref:Glycosyl transferase family 1 domain-containing protein n=1 Tax=Candidatus Daviesbacteria bacterium RIFCSPHIGHO2_02_FULL_36_13 TaxID=1797768 RepID=A0A1F5JNL7_9BACT|nr:MAG: hypothetical protein A3C59_04770 [Candidatus Daviesbacteria bacterium RIFCSPHIGHO2_02_FULL_36_13]